MFKLIRSGLEKHRENKLLTMQKKAKELAELKANVIKYIDTTLTDKEVEDYNTNRIINSAGWSGGNWTEADIKRERLNKHSDLFEESEYQSLKVLIAEQEKEKIKVDVVNFINNPLSEEEVKRYNNNISNMRSSNRALYFGMTALFSYPPQWRGGYWPEDHIKMKCLMDNMSLFNEVEYESLYNSIVEKHQEKVKSKKIEGN